MHTLLDINIVYPEGDNSFWALISGDIPKVKVVINKIEIPHEFLGKDYASDPEFKTNFQSWLNQIWLDKDKQLSDLKNT